MVKKVDDWVIVVIVILAALLIANLFVSGTIFKSIAAASEGASLSPFGTGIPAMEPIDPGVNPTIPTPLACDSINSDPPLRTAPAVYTASGASDGGHYSVTYNCRQNLERKVKDYIETLYSCGMDCSTENCKLVVRNYQIGQDYNGEIVDSQIGVGVLGMLCSATVTAQYGCTAC